MIFTKEDLKNLDRVERLKLINAVTGIKPANLIGTINSEGITNLAIFSSVVHLGSNPPYIGFILRPSGEVPRNTYENILENNSYTINHIHPNFIEKAHYTSAKFDKEVSEFNKCALTEEFVENIKAPFVKESNFKMALIFKEEIPISLNNTSLIIGEIEHLIVSEDTFVNNDINLEASHAVGISGLNSYYSLTFLESFPYARVEDVPLFTSKK